MAVLGFVFWLLVAHLYSPGQVGIASTLISSMSFISYLSLLGFNSTFIRFLPTSKNRNEHINTGLILVTIAAMIAGSLFVLCAPHFAPRLGLLDHNLLFGVSFVLLCIGATLNLITDSIFVAYRSAGYNFLIDGVIGSSVQLLLPLAFISLGAFGIYVAQGSATLVAMALSFVFLMKKFRYQPRFRVKRTILNGVLHYSSANYVASLLNTVPIIILPIIILNKLGAAPAGYYYLAFMMANVLFAIAYAVAQSFFAEGSYGERELLLLAKRAALFLSVTMIPASLLLAGVGPLVLQIFGKSYSNHGGQVLIVLAAVGPVLAAGALGSVALRITKHGKTLILTNSVYALLICGLALLWAQRGLVWVAGAWFCGQAVTTVATYLALWMHYRRHALTVHMTAE